MKILVAGASGLVGYEIVQKLAAMGHVVRTLSRTPANTDKLRAFCKDVRLADATRAETLVGVCDDVDVVCSALGASVGMQHPDKRGFHEVDLLANQNLLACAQRAGVRRFVYVAVHVEPGYADTAYVRAHEAFVASLGASGMAYGVVRPTGIFGALAELVDMARKGVVPTIGDGGARTNPVHERDVADACVEAITSNVPSLDIDIGGPEVLTRRQLAELAFTAVGKPPRIMGMPAFVMRLVATLLGLVDRRRGELFAFVARVSTTDCVAPQRGRHKLGDFLAERARRTKKVEASPTRTLQA